MIYPKTLADI